MNFVTFKSRDWDDNRHHMVAVESVPRVGEEVFIDKVADSSLAGLYNVINVQHIAYTVEQLDWKSGNALSIHVRLRRVSE